MDPLVDAVYGSVSPILDELASDAKDALMATLDEQLSEAALLESAQDDWSYAVGIWNGAELELGYYYEGEFTEAVPELGNYEMPFNATYEYLGKIACNDDDVAVSCIELGFTSSLPEDVAEKLS